MREYLVLPYPRENSILSRLKIELVDVAAVKNEGLAEEDIVTFDFKGAEGAGCKAGRARLELIAGHRRRRIDC